MVEPLIQGCEPVIDMPEETKIELPQWQNFMIKLLNVSPAKVRKQTDRIKVYDIRKCQKVEKSENEKKDNNPQINGDG